MEGFSFEMPEKGNLLDELTLIPVGNHLFEISHVEYIENDPYEKDYLLFELMFLEPGNFFGKILKKKYKINSNKEDTRNKNIKEFAEFCDQMFSLNTGEIVGNEHLKMCIGKQVLAKVGQWKKDDRSRTINVVYSMMPYNPEKNTTEFQFPIETGIQAPQTDQVTTQILNDDVPF